MTQLTSTGSRAIIRVTTLLVALFFPATAWAGWGEENWGEMIWTQALAPVPSLSVLGQIALAVLLLALPAGLLVRHRRGAKA